MATKDTYFTLVNMLEEKTVSCYHCLRMPQKNGEIRHLQSSRMPAMFNYIGSEHRLCERLSNPQAGNEKFLNFPISAKTQYREETIRKDTRAPCQALVCH